MVHRDPANSQPATSLSNGALGPSKFSAGIQWCLRHVTHGWELQFRPQLGHDVLDGSAHTLAHTGKAVPPTARHFSYTRCCTHRSEITPAGCSLSCQEYTASLSRSHKFRVNVSILEWRHLHRRCSNIYPIYIYFLFLNFESVQIVVKIRTPCAHPRELTIV